MSHYSVAVFVDKLRDLEVSRLLAPYDESLIVPHVISREDLINNERRSFERYRDTYYAEYLKNPEEYIAKCSNKEHIEYISKEFPERLKWTDEDFYQYAIRYVDKDNILPDGSVKENYNPHAKWDWWEIGGRWSGMINGDDSARVGDVIDILPDDFVTYAAVTPDGVWHAPGDMGWFGCSTDTESEWDEWQRTYKKRYLDTADPNWHIFIVDCHI